MVELANAVILLSFRIINAFVVLEKLNLKVNVFFVMLPTANFAKPKTYASNVRIPSSLEEITHVYARLTSPISITSVMNVTLNSAQLAQERTFAILVPTQVLSSSIMEHANANHSPLSSMTQLVSTALFRIATTAHQRISVELAILATFSPIIILSVFNVQ